MASATISPQQLYSPLYILIICWSNLTVRQMIRLFRGVDQLHLELIPSHQPTHHFCKQTSVGLLLLALHTPTGALSFGGPLRVFPHPLSCHTWLSRRRLLKVTVRLTSKEATRYRWNLRLSYPVSPRLNNPGGPCQSERGGG